MKGYNVTIHTDGGARGNPGPAGLGVVIEYDGHTKKYSEYLGHDKTNNDAEYEALIFALKKTKQLVGKENAKHAQLHCFSDSELMVKQLNHEYKLKEQRIQQYFIEIWNLMLDFDTVTVRHVRREHNKEADQLANQAMDEHQPKRKLF